MSDADATTQSLLTDLMEAVNSIGTELHSFRVSTESRLDKIEQRLDSLEATMNERFEGVESSITVLSGDVTRLRGRTMKTGTIDLRSTPEGESKRT